MNERIIMYRDKLMKDMKREELINIINELASDNKILHEQIYKIKIKAIDKGIIL